ncbi:Protein GET1 [Escovopsis weberi]|uniref:Protein GET1 n=1 Tax=Escovopsis weberi TaxID=150374 RepID=A0A0M8MV30_ESCWE|nr:Protein GET1 [Escovopsis weberi]
MASLLVIVFLIEVAVRLVDAVGASTLNDLLWTAINYLPVSTAKEASRRRALQAEYLKVRRDMNATSSQDEFAKWAKLRRTHDKLLEELEKAKKSSEASRSQFDKYLTTARLLLTRAPQWVLPLWYAKTPIFWLPHGWFPYYAEWLIAFPRAPLGSVSIASWQLACAGAVLLLSDLLGGLVRAVLGRGGAAPAGKEEEKQQQQQQQQAQKQSM